MNDVKRCKECTPHKNTAKPTFIASFHFDGCDAYLKKVCNNKIGNRDFLIRLRGENGTEHASKSLSK